MGNDLCTFTCVSQSRLQIPCSSGSLQESPCCSPHCCSPELSVPPVRAAVCQPTHPAATCPCGRHRDLRARTGDKKCLGSSTCLPSQHLHQPAMATATREGEIRGCRGWGKHCQEDFGASSVCVFISERCILEREFQLCA